MNNETDITYNYVIDPIKTVNSCILILPFNTTNTNAIAIVNNNNYYSTRWATLLHSQALIERKRKEKERN